MFATHVLDTGEGINWITTRRVVPDGPASVITSRSSSAIRVHSPAGADCAICPGLGGSGVAAAAASRAVIGTCSMPRILHLARASSNGLHKRAPPGRRHHPAICGAVAEWSKALAWKVSIRQNRIEGSNPSRSAIKSQT